MTYSAPTGLFAALLHQGEDLLAMPQAGEPLLTPVMSQVRWVIPCLSVRSQRGAVPFGQFVVCHVVIRESRSVARVPGSAGVLSVGYCADATSLRDG